MDNRMQPTTLSDLEKYLSYLEYLREEAIKEVCRRFDDKISAVKMILADQNKTATQDVVVSESSFSRDGKKMTIKEGVIEVLKENRGHGLRASEIADNLKQRGFGDKSANFTQTVFIAANRLSTNNGPIEKITEKTSGGVAMTYFKYRYE